MPSEEQMKPALQEYIDAFGAQDADRLIALFAEDATIEDPVGTDRVTGIEAIAKFYRRGVGFVTHMQLSAPIRASHGSSAAMAFDFEMEVGGKKLRTSAIDVMDFTDDGLITRMRAYWGPSDSRAL